MATESGGSTKPVAVIILGADALLAARPATPIQLWHACLAAGYDLAVPATWGDELIAAECLRAVGSHPETVTVMCSCPLVARALGDADADLSGRLISLVAPPVATARYLRRVYGDRKLHLSYVGACPAAGDSAIDAWLSPSELLERFAVNAIDLHRQPQLFESVLPPDRRRHLSLPGGVPTPERAASLARPRQVTELADDDIFGSIRRHLTSGVRTLVDVAPRFGCACSGAVAGVVPAEARLAVALVEPPRSVRPVMVDPVGLALLRRVPPRLPARPDVRKPDERAVPLADDRAAATRESERPIATSRTHSRSPLSWNLRERALPQPPTSGRPSGTSAGRGSSSATWSALHPPRANGPSSGPASAPSASATAGPGEPDAETAAAVRALEAAAKSAGRVQAESARVEARGGEAVAEAPRPRTADAGPSHQALSETPLASGTKLPNGEARNDDTVSSRSSRGTPPGGYWFVPPVSGGESDAEVERVSAPAGDTFSAAEAAPIDASASDAPAPDTPAPDAPAPDAPAPDAPAPDAPIPESKEQESVVAELESLFSQSTRETLAGGPPEAATDPSPEATGETPPAPNSGAPAPREESPPEPARDVLAAARAKSPPEARRAVPDGEGPAPDRPWVVTMTIILLVAGAVLARNVAQRRGERSVADRPLAAPVESVSNGILQLAPEVVSDVAAESAAAEPLSPKTIVSPPRRPVRVRPRSSTRLGSASATADSVTTLPQAPPAPVKNAAADSAQAARDAEVRSIREELARRAARLDSMGRAVGVLFAVPRAAPPPVAPPPPYP